MITDEGNAEEERDKKAVIVEFINNEAVLVDNGRDYLTNFHLIM